MKRNYFQDEKLKYEDIEIPDELLLMVRRTVAEDRRKKMLKRRMRILKTAGSVAAVLFLCLTIGVNSSYAFAEAAVKIPVVKDVAQAVVMRSYRSEIVEVYKENKSSKPKKKAEVEPEKEPEEIAVTESGNEVSGPEEITQIGPGGAQQTPAEPLSGLEAWKAEMTPEKLREVKEIYSSELEKKYADTPEKLRTILLAQLPQEDISLYGYHEDGKMTGTALRIGEKHQYFDWNYMNESGKLPELSCEDIDGDGKKEVIVLLYNGAYQKKEISKEDIQAPGTETTEGGGATADTGEAQDTKTADTDKKKSEDKPTGTEVNKAASGEESVSAKTPVKENTSTEGVGEGLSDANAAGELGGDPSSVSDNDIGVPAESEEKPVEPAGELWTVSVAGETWTAALLSRDDCESQILHQLKAAYDAQTGALQLYLVEEPFGDPITLSSEPLDGASFEDIGIAPVRTFVIKEGITLRFGLEAVFQTEAGEKVLYPLEKEWKAKICLEEGSLVLENIQEL